MRKTKYTEELVGKICFYLTEGYSNRVAMEKAGITKSTFYDWINTKKDFSERVKKAKEIFLENITAKLEMSLWKKATGYEVEEKEEEYITKNGQRILKYQKVKKKQIAPDTAALIFALTNVAPYKWKNMQKIETKEIKEENDAPIYSFDDLPDDVLFKITDELQNVEQKRLEALKNGDNGEKTE